MDFGMSQWYSDKLDGIVIEFHYNMVLLYRISDPLVVECYP